MIGEKWNFFFFSVPSLFSKIISDSGCSINYVTLKYILMIIVPCSARTRTEQGYLENPQQKCILSPSRASSRTRLLRSPHANAGMKQYECGRTQPFFV
jgi:hypothetical protein